MEQGEWNKEQSRGVKREIGQKAWGRRTSSCCTRKPLGLSFPPRTLSPKQEEGVRKKGQEQQGEREKSKIDGHSKRKGRNISGVERGVKEKGKSTESWLEWTEQNSEN